MKEKIFKKGLSKRILSLVVALVMMITLLPGMSVEVKAASISTVSTKEDFLASMNNAKDGDVIKLGAKISLIAGNSGNGDCFRIPQGCLVTLDLNGYTLDIGQGTGSNNFGIGANSALLVKDGSASKTGTIGVIDTNESDTGILILNGVRVTGKLWLGRTQAWIVNGSNINSIYTEDGVINPGADSLNPVGTKTDKNPYNYPNSAPAMVGSGVTWKCLATLQDDFNQAQNSGYNNIILLKDATLGASSELTAANIHFNLGGYTLTTNGKELSMANTSGTNTIKNGTINGNITMGDGAGNVLISGVDMTGTATINNAAHPTTIENGHYGSIEGGTGKITINNSNAFFAGTLSGNNYEITAGYFVNRPSENYITSAYDIVPVSITENGVTYKYTVKQNTHDWKYSTTENAGVKKLVATCNNNSKHKYELTISVDDQEYSDTPTEPTIRYGTDTEKSAWTTAGLALPGETLNNPTITKKYYATDGDGNKAGEFVGSGSSTVPNELGKYFVDVEISYGEEDGKTVSLSVPYNIKKRSTADITGTSITGGKKQLTITGMKPDQDYIVTTESDPNKLTDADWADDKLVKPTSGDPTIGVAKGLDEGTLYYVYTRTKDGDDTEPGTPLLVQPPTKTDFGQPNNNKTGYIVDEDGTITIDSDNYEVFVYGDGNEEIPVYTGEKLIQGKTYFVRKKAEQTPGGAGAGAPIEFVYQPLSAPTDLTPVAPQCQGGSDGKITGVNDTMEYSTDGGQTWFPVTGNEITGLRQGPVKVRIKGSNPNNAGPITDITVPEGTLPEELNTAKVEPEDDGSSYKLTGVNNDMEYSTDGGKTWTDVPAPNPGDTSSVITGIPVGTVVQVRLKNSGTGTPSGSLILTAGTRPSYNNDGSGHVHEFEWGNWNRVTKDENGTMVYQCKLCGYVLEKEYIPAYAYTCLTESEHVLKTPQNGSVICEMGRWNAYPRWFFEKLATRPDVNITLKFLYQHKQYTVYIPAGTKIDTEHDWYGPLKICSLYKFEVK